MSGQGQAIQEMMDGYSDGRADDRIDLPHQNNFSPAYVQGWLNGRDDRLHSPRASAFVLREQAERILNSSVVSPPCATDENGRSAEEFAERPTEQDGGDD
ncbi:hypothetical protein ACLBWS_05840 [Brucellaceae bacterium D45D]